MNQAPANFQELARRIVERATADCESPAQVARAIESTFIQLRELMSGMVGKEGFHALVGRALYLSRVRLPQDLSLFSELAPTSLCSGWSAGVERAGALAGVRCAALLFGDLVGLFGSFIGEDLTLRLIRRTWADALSAPGAGSGEGTGHERKS